MALHGCSYHCISLPCTKMDQETLLVDGLLYQTAAVLSYYSQRGNSPSG